MIEIKEVKHKSKEMKLAIMQPYLFPYIGYFQLINAVDKFVIYDDVHFINCGWINRNRILVNGEPFLFSVPLKKASQNKLIKELELVGDKKQMNKLLKCLEINYKKAPYFNIIYPIIADIILTRENMLSRLILYSIRKIIDYLNIDTEIVETSTIYQNCGLKGQERIIDICKIEKAAKYINAFGGNDLYSKERFNLEGITLNYLKTNIIIYNQYENNFVPNLSIIDMLMFNSNIFIKEYLNRYDLV